MVPVSCPSQAQQERSKAHIAREKKRLRELRRPITYHATKAAARRRFLQGK